MEDEQVEVTIIQTLTILFILTSSSFRVLDFMVHICVWSLHVVSLYLTHTYSAFICILPAN